MKHLKSMNERINSNVGKTIEILSNKRKESIGLEQEMDLTIGEKYKVIETGFSNGTIYIIDDSGLRIEIPKYMYKYTIKK